VEVQESKGGFAGYAGASRFDEMTHFGSSYATPGWQRARRNKDKRSGGFDEAGQDYSDEAKFRRDEGDIRAAGFASGSREGGTLGRRPRARPPFTIEGELVARSTGAVSEFNIGDRVFHQKFGNGNITAIDGNKLIVAFDKAGEKRVVDSYVERL
jgi:DNA helicase-2/ATP-dependent DNA helicase PcrA